MLRINLLPWRAARRRQRQRDFMVMLGSSILGAVALSFLVIGYYDHQIDGQDRRNAYLRERIAQVRGQLGESERVDAARVRLQERSQAIGGLQAERARMVHLFNALARTIPEGVVLTSVRQQDARLTLEGRARSNALVRTYLRKLEGAGWMREPELSVIEAGAGSPGLPLAFSLDLALADPGAPAQAGKVPGTAQPPAAAGGAR